MLSSLLAFRLVGLTCTRRTTWSHSTVNDRDAQDCINIFPPTLIGSSAELLLYLCARLYTSLCGDFNTCLQHVLPLQTLSKKCVRILHPNNPPFACIEAHYRVLLLVYQLYVLELSVHWTGMSSSAFVLLKFTTALLKTCPSGRTS